MGESVFMDIADEDVVVNSNTKVQGIFIVVYDEGESNHDTIVLFSVVLTSLL